MIKRLSKTTCNIPASETCPNSSTMLWRDASSCRQTLCFCTRKGRCGSRPKRIRPVRRQWKIRINCLAFGAREPEVRSHCRRMPSNIRGSTLRGLSNTKSRRSHNQKETTKRPLILSKKSKKTIVLKSNLLVGQSPPTRPTKPLLTQDRT